MIIRLLTIATAVLATHASATTPVLTSITQPLYYLGSAGDAEFQFIEMPKILNNSDLMFWVGLFHSPSEIKGSDGDMNLISIYGLTVALGDRDSKGRPTLILVDSSEAKRPPRYPFTVEAVTDAAIKAIRFEFPNEDVTKIEIKHLMADTESERSESDRSED